VAQTRCINAFLAHRLDPKEITGLLLTVALGLLLAAGVVFGSVLEMVTSERGLYRWDSSVARWGAEHTTSTSTTVLKAVTQAGSTPGVFLLATVVAGVFVLRRRELRVAAFLAVVVVGQNLLANGTKVLVDRDRPDVRPLVHATGLSFPSGHTTAAAATFAAVAFVIARRQRTGVQMALGGAAALATVAVATTRVLLGVHWLTDVIAGAALGLAWFVVCAIAFGGRLLRFGAPVEEAVEATGRAP
jgi:membrane-associated phospholipid phosphatase